MSDNEDNFGWAIRLGCPLSALTDSVKKSLNSGIMSLLWDELASSVHSSKEVLQTRKNILLYKLKHGEKDSLIQQIRNTQQLRAARRKLDPQIQSLEEKCETKDFQVRQKLQHLAKVRELGKSLKTKEDLLQLKYNQMQTQLKDCKTMLEVCQHSMPATSREIDPETLDEIVSLISEVSTKADKRIVSQKVSEMLSPIDISTMWNALLSKRTRDTEELIALGTQEIITDAQSANGENIDIGMARVCGKHVATAAQKIISRAKVAQHQKLIVEYFEKIEKSGTNAVNVSDWLTLTLEVGKLEAKQSSLLSEIDACKKTLENQSELTEELRNLESAIISIDAEVEKCVQDIQKSLCLLKLAASNIAKSKEKLAAALQPIVTLNSEKQSVDYLHVDLTEEMNIFYDSIQLEALKKIVLKDAVGEYRHTKCCMSEAQLSITASPHSTRTSHFPMIRAPIYELMFYFKNFLAASYLAKFDNETYTNERIDTIKWPENHLKADCSTEAIEILNVTDLTCEKARQEMLLFNSIFDAWNNQTVQKAMALDDRVVNGATFKEWYKRYNTLLYMLQRNK